MRRALLVLGMLLSSALVGCHTCSHCDGSFVGNDGVTYKPVKPNPIVAAFKKKDCSCKKHKHKHKGSDNCPFCASEGEFASNGGMVYDGMNMGGTGCSGCGAPTSVGSLGCSSCGTPSGFPMTTSNCSSCGGGFESAPVSGCSACQGGIPHGSTPTLGPVFNGEVVPGSSPAPAPPAEPAPLREATPPAPMSPAGNQTTLIPILPPSSSPRHVHWVPTPVK